MKVICGDGGAEYRELRKKSAESGEIADFLQAWSELAIRRRATKANDTLRLRKNRAVCAPANTTRMRSTDDHMSTRVWFGNDGGDAASKPARALHDFYDGMFPPRVYPERLVSSLALKLDTILVGLTCGGAHCPLRRAPQSVKFGISGVLMGHILPHLAHPRLSVKSAPDNQCH